MSDEGEKKKLFFCKKCSKAFNHSGNRCRHERECKHDTDIERPSGTAQFDTVETTKSYPCANSSCNLTFTKKFNLQRHMKLCFKRQSQDNKQCFLCKKVFNRMTHLRRHMESHQNNTTKKFRCPGCKDLFVRKDHYDRHISLCSSSPSMVNLKEQYVPEIDLDNSNIYNSSTSPFEDSQYFIMVNDTICTTSPLLQQSNYSVVNEDNISSSDFTVEDSYENSYGHKPSGAFAFAVSSDENEDNHEGGRYENNYEHDSFENQDGDVNEETYIECKNASSSTNSDSGEHQGKSFFNDFNDFTIASNDNEPEDEPQDDEPPEIFNKDDMRFKLILADSTKKYLKKQLRLARYRVKKRVEVARFIIDFFDEQLEDKTFFSWLGAELSIGEQDKFREFLSWATKDKNSGFICKNNAISPELRLKVYENWKKNSIISVDRRNNRYAVRISQKKINNLCQDLPDEDVNSVATKRGFKLEAHRHIYTKPIRALHSHFIAENDYISLGSFLALKPFYIFAPTEVEKQSCMCITCLNIHLVYDALRKHVKASLPDSLCSFLTSDFKCEVDNATNFNRLECVSFECGNGCEIKNKCTDLFQHVCIQKLHAYYLFERIPTFYYKSSGEKVSYTRTARVDKK